MDEEKIIQKIIEEYELCRSMWIVRQIAAKGLRLRKEAGIPLRQPLAKLSVSPDFIKKLSEEYDQHYLKTGRRL